MRAMKVHLRLGRRYTACGMSDRVAARVTSDLALVTCLRCRSHIGRAAP
jgi:hypothetical protein